MSKTTPEYWEEAKRVLSERDAAMAELIARYEGEGLQSRGDAFYTLARSIAGQQISVKAADSVWGRLEGGLGEVVPRRLLAVSDEDLRGHGLSRQKVLYLKHIAEAFDSGALPVDRFHAMEDEAIIEALVGLKGVGRWTAEMFLMFHMLRPDVLPLADLGLLAAAGRLYGSGEKMAAKEVRELGEQWRPFRSVATWYLWRSLDPVAVEY